MNAPIDRQVAPEGDVAYLARRGGTAGLVAREVQGMRVWRQQAMEAGAAAVPLMRSAAVHLRRLGKLYTKRCEMVAAEVVVAVAADLEREADRLGGQLDIRSPVQAAAAVHIKTGGDG